MTRSFLSTAEVAGDLGISIMSIYRLIATGKMPAIRVGGQYRIPADAYRQWIADGLNAVKGSNEGANKSDATAQTVTV